MRLTQMPRVRRMPSSGMSIVELLVGVAIGLFILAGATLVTGTQLSDNRQLLLETQIQQDLRTTSDLVARELRRSGYWGLASTTAWPAVAAPPNMYQIVDFETLGAGDRAEINFAYSKALTSGAENSVVDADEQFGFAHNPTDKTIEVKLGAAGWQTMTDPNVVHIGQFKWDRLHDDLNVPCAKFCGSPEVAGDTSCWPKQIVNTLVVQITGEAAHDSTVKRTVRSGVRLRNDVITGACPA